MQRLALARFDALYLCLPPVRRVPPAVAPAPVPPVRSRPPGLGGGGVCPPPPGASSSSGAAPGWWPHRPAGGQLSCTLSGRGPALRPSGPPFARIRPPPPPEPGLDRAGCRRPAAQSGRPGLLLPAAASLMPVIKANAYGHGDLEIARLCAGAGADAFAVATAAEGVRLRRGGVRGRSWCLAIPGRSWPPCWPGTA